jgi:spore photoproduct lyase
MQSYLRNRTLEVHVPTDDTLRAIVTLARENETRTIRFGTGEVGDSLLFDPLFDLSRIVIDSIRMLPNVRFELKTKTDSIDHLLDLDHGGNVVIAFSLNAPDIARDEEGDAADVSARIEAARRAADAGYRVAFHFDPIILVDGWRDRYRDLVAALARFRDIDVEWISLGTLRYPTALRPWIQQRPYSVGEFVEARDGKMRYPQAVRLQAYRHMQRQLRAVLPAVPVYMCMENRAVWRHVSTRYGDARLRDILQPIPGYERRGTT